MKTVSIKRCILMSVVLAFAGLSLPVSAGGYYGHGGGGGYHGGGGWHGGGSWHAGNWWGFGLGVGLGYLGASAVNSYYYSSYPTYYYPATPVYYAPAYNYVPVQTAPTYTYQAVPVQTAASPPSPPPSAPSWYYCASARGYYPNVRECREAWQIVPSTPPGAIR
ncbi:hypothetical protein [Pseudomonas abieticivorans]|uniref:hypothetical protein n=1 Tax=Pseudomonas abieticivorans TaxID=2931382 RepID=UPI0020C03ADA|nr:hypothetical protein [Pseudomonas sp. PIA16]